MGWLQSLDAGLLLGGGKQDQMGAGVVIFLAKAREVEDLLPEALISEVGCGGFDNR